MRDPNRIDKFCDELNKLWHKVPDWRFGQFMWNIISACQAKGIDTFYMEDDKMMEFLKEYFKEIIDE